MRPFLPAVLIATLSLTSACASAGTAPTDPTTADTAAGTVISSVETSQDDAATSQHPTTDPAPEEHRTVYPLAIDNCGTTVTFDKAPERVVAIKSTSIEMMFALGLADRLVGVAFPDGPYAAEWAPEVDPPLISDKVPGQETTLALEPDMIYAGWESNLTAEGAGDRAELTALGIGTLVSPAACQEPDYQPTPLTWDDIWSEIELVGEIFDVQDRAAGLVAQLQGRLAAITPDARGLTALWYSSGTKAGIPYVGAGIGSPQLDMDAIGLANIAADIPMTWSSMSWEAVMDVDPDVIIVVDSSWGPAEWKIGTFTEDPAVAALTAVAKERYLIVPFPAAEAGVRSVEAAEILAKQLADLDLT